MLLKNKTKTKTKNGSEVLLAGQVRIRVVSCKVPKFKLRELRRLFCTETRLQLFRVRLSYESGKAYAAMSKVIMGNGSFYGCLIEPQGVLARWNEKAQTRVFFLSRFLLLNHLESSEAELAPPESQSTLSCTLLQFVGQPLLNQLYILVEFLVILH